MKRRNFIKNTISTAGLISFPNLILGNNKEVNFALGGWAVDSMQKIINELEFTKETGIKVNILKRPGDADFASKMLGAFQANTSPYDIFDDSDASTQFIGSGFIEPLDDLLPKNFLIQVDEQIYYFFLMKVLFLGKGKSLVRQRV